MTDSAVRLNIPASSGYLVLARTAVAAVCARQDFPIDRLEDVKLAIDEACSLVLSDSIPGEGINIDLSTQDDGDVVIVVSGRTNHGRPPKRTSFSWTVLTALVDDVEAAAEPDGLIVIRLRAGRGADSPSVAK